MSQSQRRGRHAGRGASAAPKARPKRLYNVYDAVAGRVRMARRRPRETSPASESSSDEPCRRRQLLAPEEVLFRSQDAPTRYAEKDIYDAHLQLPHGGDGILPDSDMLKAIHRYTSQFYAAVTTASAVHGPGGEVESNVEMDESSMDETALLAFGILLEEAGRDALGSEGDLVLTEGVALDEHAHSHDGLDPLTFLDTPILERTRGEKVEVGVGEA